MASIDNTIVAVGLPTILVSLATTLPLLAWTLTGFSLTQTVVMPVAGKLSDELGRKNIFLAAVVIFTTASIGCGLAPNIYVLIVCRVLQALGGGAFLPCATGIISDAFGDRRQTAIGLFTSIFPLGGILGPNIGGFIIDNASWRWLFFVNLPIGVLVLVAAFFVLPRSRPTGPGQRIDTTGVVLFAGGITSILYAMTFIANHADELGNPQPWLCFAAGFVLLALFIRQESRTPNPMIELQLLRRGPFLAANAYSFVFGACVFGFFSFIPYYAQVAYKISAGESGAVLTPRSILMATTSTLCSIYVIRHGYRRPMIIGLLIIVASLFLLSRGWHDVTIAGVAIPNVITLAALVGVGGFGMGIQGPATQNAALDLIPDKLAAVAGLRGMFNSTGGVIGTATITLVINQFQNKGQGLQDVFLALSVLLLLALPIVFFIPDLARDRRTARISRVGAEAAALAD